MFRWRGICSWLFVSCLFFVVLVAERGRVVGGVVRRGGSARRRAGAGRPRSSCVSCAIWPPHTWRCVATGWWAQFQRSLVLFVVRYWNRVSAWWRPMHVYRMTHPVFVRCQWLFGMCGYGLLILSLSAVFHRSAWIWRWPVLLALLVFCLCIMFVVFCFLAHLQRKEIQRWVVAERCVRSGIREVVPRAGGMVEPVPLVFPDTPVPVFPTPRVRVLETVDLSATNVEHFIDTQG